MSLRASILTIGNEVVQGRILNTNSQYLGRRLTLLGFDVVLAASVPDRMDLIIEILNVSHKRFQSTVIITTGGLGPTYDDITSEALSRYLGEEYVVNEEALRMVREKYFSRGLELTPERIKMAMMPKSASPIPNPVGTAPGIIVKKDSTFFIALPGVPSEMQAMWEQSVEPMLRGLSSVKISERTVTVKGVMESSAAKIINRLVKEHPRIYVKSQPKGMELGIPILDIYIMSSSTNNEEARRNCENVCEKLVEELRSIGGKIWDSCLCT
ncbi:MAG: nicotinamide mononucleotide deamidase-related protein [Desulfurococcales archaeon]|jgi:molybdenum cofactor synthesis domain-containing protein|nr:nicotinamide mononucleotide deamidase-related protein [Desulfurococcales archaeon]